MTLPSDAERIARAFADPRALEHLRRLHREQARADLGRIHPTWLARALREESPAVRATIAANSIPALGRLLRAQGDLPIAEARPHPEVLAWVLSLWTERLVGGSDGDDDPPVLAGLMRTSPREAYRLWREVGLVKWSLAEEEARTSWVEKRLGTPTADVRTWAARDLDAARRLVGAVWRLPPLLGLATAFRLLADCEPHAMRWALQRIPYPIVRQARALTPPTTRRSTAVSRLETLILRTAWDRLYAQGRIAVAPPAGTQP